MSSFRASRRVFSVLFLVTLFGAAVFNFLPHREGLERVALSVTRPRSEREARATIALLDGAVKTRILGKTKFLDAYSYIQVLLGKEEIDNFTLVRAQNNALNQSNFFIPPMDWLREGAARIRRVETNMRKKNPDFKGLLFLSPPELVNWGKPVFSRGLPYANLNPVLDAFQDHLREFGVEHLDAREVLRDRGLDANDIMYKTDHHWKNETCFMVFQKLVETLDKRFHLNLDPDGFFRNPDHYGFRTFPNIFLGFTGRSAGVSFSGGLEDFTVIWPRFETDFQLDYVSAYGYVTKSGSAMEALLYPELLSPKDIYSSGFYSFYLYGINSWAKIINRKNPNGPKLMMINDSFGPPLAAFLAPMFSEIHMIWPRAEALSLDIDAYLADNDFDVVLIELYGNNLNIGGIHFGVE